MATVPKKASSRKRPPAPKPTRAGAPALPEVQDDPITKAEMRTRCRALAARAVGTMAALMDVGEPGLRLQAAQAILDRGYGKVPVALVGDDEEAPLRVKVGVDDATARVLDQIAARLAGGDETP